MKKGFCFVLLFAATAVVAVPVIRSAAEPDYPPLSIVTAQGEASGFSVELLRAALAIMGREVQFETAPWNELLQRFATGEFEVLPLVGRTPEREALFDFSIPYLTLHGALFVQKDHPDIRGLADLPGRTVAVMRGDNAEEYVRRAKLTDRIVTTETFEEAFRMLSEGQVDAVIAQKLMGITLLKKTGITNVKVTGTPNEEFKQDFCFGVKKENDALLALINEGLALTVQNGTKQRLQQKWLNTAFYETALARTLIYGGDRAFPPYEYLDEKGQPAGFNIELARALARELGVNISFHLKPWEEIREEMEAGKIDLAAMFYSKERDRVVDFSTPITAAAQAVFVRKNSASFNGLDSLRNQRISVQSGDFAHDYLLENGFSNEQLVVTQTPQDALRLLAEGEVDFSLCALLQGRYWIEKKKWSNLRAAENNLFVADYCFAVPEGQTALLGQINERLTLLKESGEYRTLYNRWMGAFDENIQRARFLQILLVIGSLFAVIIAAVLYLLHLLRRQVRKRTAELEAANCELKESRRATLNMMEDALQAKQRLEITQYALDHAADEVFWIRSDGSFAYVNETACKALGWSRAELLELGVKDVDPEFPFEQWPQHWAELKEKKTLVFEGGHRTRDGIEYPVEIHACYLRFGGEEYNCAFAHNIAHRKEAKDKIQHQLEELQRWQNATSGREGRVMELKKEINRLLKEMGRPPKYGSVQHD